MTTEQLAWIKRRGQIKNLLFEHCLNGRITKADLKEQFEALNEVEPTKRGRNIADGHCRGYKNTSARIFLCSECGYGFDDIYLCNELDYPIEPNYCPNCGAKMDEVEE